MRIIIPALAYADFLAVTLPAWRALLPRANITVVTGQDDASLDVARACGVSSIVTRVWDMDGASFNKARALSEAIGMPPPTDGETCIVADADVVPFGLLPPLATGALYGCARYACPTPDVLERHRVATLTRPQLTLIPPRRRGQEPEYGTVTALQAAEACTGYFQAFRYRPGLTFGSYPTAAGYDSAFRSQFTRCVGLTDFYVLHLGELSRENWKGRVVPPWPSGVSA